MVRDGDHRLVLFLIFIWRVLETRLETTLAWNLHNPRGRNDELKNERVITNTVIGYIQFQATSSYL